MRCRGSVTQDSGPVTRPLRAWFDAGTRWIDPRMGMGRDRTHGCFGYRGLKVQQYMPDLPVRHPSFLKLPREENTQNPPASSHKA